MIPSEQYLSMEEKHVNLGLQVVPLCPPEQTYALVDAAIAAIKASGVKHEVGPFETSMEGPYDELMRVVASARDACLAAGARELLLNLRVQIRAGEDVSMDEKTSKHRL